MFSALDTDWLGLLDLLAGNVLLIAGGLGLSLVVGYASPAARAELARHRWATLWVGALRFVAPPALLFALVYAFAAFWGGFVAYFGGA